MRRTGSEATTVLGSLVGVPAACPDDHHSGAGGQLCAMTGCGIVRAP
jgi:hypothetical protein